MAKKRSVPTLYSYSAGTRERQELPNQVVRLGKPGQQGEEHYIEIAVSSLDPSMIEIRGFPDSLVIQPVVSNVLRIGMKK